MPFKDKLNRPCGFLDIDEDDKRKKFRRRYFILNKCKGLLEWYTDSPANLAEDVQPCGTVKLDYITKVDEVKKMKKDFCFVINTPFRPYYVHAGSQSEVETWVEILNDAGKIVVPPEALYSQLNIVEASDSTSHQDPGDGGIEAAEQGATYRTEIIGNVVVKRKIMNEHKEIDETSPSFNSSGSDSKFLFAATDTGNDLLAAFVTDRDVDVVMHGWAVKQGHVRKNWKRRYFVLKSEGFAYYKSEQEKEPIRVVAINDILAAREDDGNEPKPRDNLLLVATTDKIYYMQTDTPEAVQAWIDAFNLTIKANEQTGNNKVNKSNTSEVHYTHGYNGDVIIRAVCKFHANMRPDAVNSPRVCSKVKLPTWDSAGMFCWIHRLYQWLQPGRAICIVVYTPLVRQFDHIQSSDVIDETSSRSASQFKKRISAQSVFAQSTFQDNAEHHASSSDSIDEVTKQTSEKNKFIKSHRRAESAVTSSVTSSNTIEGSLSNVRVGKQNKEALKYHLEDVMVRPEARSYRPLSMATTMDHPNTHIGHTASRSSSGDYVASHLDPIVDLRAAVKPSIVKKKKNSGITFSLNTMLHRKQDRMKKEKDQLNRIGKA